MNYTILKDTDPVRLSQLIDKYMSGGWTCQGGVGYNCKDGVWYQAMTNCDIVNQVQTLSISDGDKLVVKFSENLDCD